ncbi:hypothetical protein DYB32_008213 [Aphanomyces invadans]|uniref:Uncharacterized protein n=1 Tax=Aphanomyces invadans TaxID=157072 RepID=A0A418ALV5_9STRA|nr:hypothetical protein DYB32_008213 [Aphanomyces invadans]
MDIHRESVSMETPYGKAALTEAEYAALEKELYEESIRGLEDRLKDLQNGTLDEFVERCRAFEIGKTHEVDLANLHRTLLLQNISELLAFDLRQIEDGHNASVGELQSANPPRIDAAQHVEVEVPTFISPAPVTTHTDDQLQQELEQFEYRKHLHFSMDHLKACVPSVTTIQHQLTTLRESLASVNKRLRQATRMWLHSPLRGPY